MTALGPTHGVADLIFVAKELVRVAGVQRVEVPCDRDVPLRFVIVVVLAPEQRDSLIGKRGNVVPVGPIEAEKELIGKVGAKHLRISNAGAPVQPGTADRYFQIVGRIQKRRRLCVRVPVTPCDAVATRDLVINTD
jgi:hypothetical protein